MALDVVSMLMGPALGIVLIIAVLCLAFWSVLLPWKILLELRNQGKVRHQAELQTVTLLVKILQALDREQPD